MSSVTHCMSIVSNCTAFAVIAMLLSACATEKGDAPLTALIIDGQNNHGGWPETSAMMKQYLVETGLFDVDIYRTHSVWQGPHNDGSYGGREKVLSLLDTYRADNVKSPERTEEPVPDPEFVPVFSDYDVVISNFGWKTSEWPDQTNAALEEYVNQGGGLVIIHAANNAFGQWREFNKMIGLGAWGDRTKENGPYVFIDSSGFIVRDSSDGPAGSHGPEHEFQITTRQLDHPITRGMPERWLHARDELYDRLRGPAENMTILATTYSDPEKNNPPWDTTVVGSGRHEPMLFTIDYGEGRVFHTPMGHAYYSMECVGFITSLQRGAEWAATGNVTQPMPGDFPSSNAVSLRKWEGGSR